MLPQKYDQSLVALPNSLREQLERTQSLLQQSAVAASRNDMPTALAKREEAHRLLRRLARTSPELTAGLFLAGMGHYGFECETVERVDRHQLVEYKLFGLTLASDVVNVPTVTTRTVRWRIR